MYKNNIVNQFPEYNRQHIGNINTYGQNLLIMDEKDRYEDEKVWEMMIDYAEKNTTKSLASLANY